MKPSPDDHHEIEPPKTRGGAHPDEPAPGPRSFRDLLEATDDGYARQASRPSEPSDFPPGSSLGSIPLSTGGTPIRGVSGKIEPNQILYSKYHVLKKLGGGAMGDVWLVRHTSMDDLHALKLIISNIASNQVALRRFQREFKVMASLKHPNAVQIYDASIDSEGGYIDMEYVKGQTIHDILVAARRKPDLDPSVPLMPLEWIVRILDQLTDVLQEAHEKGVVHRDLKPSNLMLLDGKKPGKEHLKVLDFGIAKIRDDPDNAANATLTQGFIGTPSYGSPEQAMSRQDIDGRSDLYSVGVMLYEFVTGRLPFKGVHFQVMHQHASVLPPSFAEANPRLRPVPELEHAIFKVLSKDREQRPQTARDFFEEIARAVEEVRGPAPIEPPPSSWNSSRKFPPAPTYPDPRTEHDGGGILVAGGPATEAITATAPGVEKKSTEDHSSTFGGSVEDRRPPWKAIRAVGVLGLALTVVTAGGYRYFRQPRAVEETKLETLAPVLPDGYEAVAGIETRDGYPEKVLRTRGAVQFSQVDKGIYIPSEYQVVDPGETVDGWPRVIARKRDESKARFFRIKGNVGWPMGAWNADPSAQQSDSPTHQVWIRSGYYLQETEVTNGQFEDFLRRTGQSGPPDWETAFADLKKAVGADVARKHPAVGIPHRLATAYAREWSGLLPTEAQWEFAARSRGDLHRFVGGISQPDDKTANILGRVDPKSAPVGSYPEDITTQKILDMTGNVKEMCRDVWRSYKQADILYDPCELVARGEETPKFVVRGGDFATALFEECSTTYRDDKRSDEGCAASNIGFRVVIECPDARPVVRSTSSSPTARTP